MKNTIRAILLGLGLCAAAPGLAAERVNETRDASADGFVRITVVRGEVSVEGWDRNQIEVKGTLDAQMEAFIFEARRSETVIEVKLPRSLNSWCCEEGSKLAIRVPRGSQVDISGVSTDVDVKDLKGSLEIQGVSGDIRISGIRDRVEVTTVSGQIDARDVGKRVELKSVSGDVTAIEVTGDVRLGSVSGDIVARKISDELDLESVSGDIDVESATFTVARGNTVSGDIDIAGALNSGGRLELDSVSGSIRVRFAGKPDARFDLATGSGNIRNRVSSDKPARPKYARDEKLRFVHGNGKGEVVIETRSGDIVISDD